MVSSFFRGRLILLLTLACRAVPLWAQPFVEVPTAIAPILAKTVQWVDCDSDGDLDLLISGTGGRPATKLYLNDGLGGFIDSGQNLGIDGVGVWADFNRDGSLDLLLTGQYVAQEFGDYYYAGYTNALFTNQGQGLLSHAGVPLPISYSVSAADADNDGAQDILWLPWPTHDARGGLLLNNGHGGFEPMEEGPGSRIYGRSQWKDLDRDGDMDPLLVESGGPAPATRLFRNEGRGRFRELPLGLGGGGGGVSVWEDFDRDGHPDLFYRDYNFGAVRQLLLRNQRDGTFAATSVVLTNSGGGGHPVDYDNDGDWDVLFPGTSEGTAYYVQRLFRNVAPSSFVQEATPFPSLINTAAAWGDIDNDGDADLLLLGSEPVFQGALRVALFRNDRATGRNTPPAAPAGLQAEQIGDELVFRWNVPVDAQTTAALLSYELRVGTRPGATDVVSPSSDPASGYRRLPQAGPILTNRWSLRGFRGGTHYWSVQAIDTGVLGSSWAAEAQFTVTHTPPSIHAPKEIRLGPSWPGTVPLTVGDAESPASELVVTAVSVDGNFVPSNRLVITGTGAQRELSLQVGAGQIGSNDVVVTVQDPQGLWSQARIRVVSEFFTSFPVSSATNLVDLAPAAAAYAGSRAPIADLDGDGDLDVLLTGMLLTNENARLPVFVVAWNDGDGPFSVSVLPGWTPSSFDYWLEDFDRDGDVDIVSRGDNHSGETAWLRNRGDGTFDPPQSLGFAGLGVFGDADSDGDLDAFVIRYEGAPGSAYEVRYYERDGVTFRLRPGPWLKLGSTQYAPLARMADLNGDSEVDFFVPDWTTGSTAFTVRSLRSSGHGVFQAAASEIFRPVYLYGVSTGDADDDGDWDVSMIYSMGYTNPIEYALLANEGQGQFVLLPVPRLLDPYAADFDNDGDRDRLLGELISTNPYRQQYRLHLKQANGAYAPQPFVLSHPGFTADFDGDGDLDYLASFEPRDEYGNPTGAPELRVFRNNFDRVNRAPDVPVGLQATPQADDRVTLAWVPALDDHTPPPYRTYNLRVGTTPGAGDVVAPASDPVTGRRWLAAPGNAGTLTFRHLRALPAGTYYWTVQAVDGAFVASAWAPERSFTLIKPSVSRIADVVTPPGLLSQPIPFSVTGGSSAVNELDVTAVADDGNLLPTNGITVSGFGADRTLTILPADWPGDTEVTVTARDRAGSSAVVRFHVRVAWWDPRPLEQFGLQRFERWLLTDVDADGWLDFLGTTEVGNGPRLLLSYRNLGGARFELVTNNLPAWPNDPVQVGGVAGDNFADILTLNMNREVPSRPVATVRVWQSTADAFQFQPLIEVSNVAEVAQVQWMDFDNDGVGDLVHFGWGAVSNNPSFGLVMARGAPDGTFRYVSQQFPMAWRQALARADFDRDGDFDLLVSGQDWAANGRDPGPRFTRLYLNEEGRFTAREAGLPQGAYYNFSIADYDADGWPDVLLLPAAGTGTPVSTARLLRNVEGEFSEVNLALPPQLERATWVDFDNDGDVDLLLFTGAYFPSTGQEAYYAGVLRNDNGQLGRVDTGLLPIVAHQAEVADLDNDGDLDLLISGETGWNRTGRFLCLNTSPKRNVPPPAPTQLRVAAALNGTLLEWAPALDPESGMGVTYNLRVGTTPGGSEILSAVADPSSGQRRLAGPGNIGQAPRWRLVLPEGTYFWSVQTVDAGYAASSFALEQTFTVRHLLVSAINDLVVGPAQSTAPLPFSISGGTAPYQVTGASSDPVLVPAEGLVFGGSGGARTLTVTPASGRSGTVGITIRVTDAEGLLASTSLVLTVLPAFVFQTGLGAPDAYASLAWGDPDRDGDLDLLVSGSRYESGGLRAAILRNDRTGQLASNLFAFTPVYRGEAVWGDADRDGDLDVLLSGYAGSSGGSPTTTLRRNDWPNGFGTVSLTRLPNLGDTAAAWADADADGDLDVLISGTASGGTRQAALYLNGGTGSFSNGLVVLPPVSEGASAWADYDRDGDPDFVLTGSTNGTALGAVSRLYRNLGGGAFEETPTLLPGVFRSALAWADFDQDGDPDLLIAGAAATGPVTQLFRNDDGTLVRTPVALPGVVDGALAWGDANLDGFPDLALCGRLGSSGGELVSRVYWNQHGVLSDSLVELPGLHLSALAWGDLDLDGKLDLAVAGSTNRALTVFTEGAYSAVFRNNLPGNPGPAPAAPINLTAQVQGNDVVLAWSLPAGTAPGLSFDLRVGRTAGGSDVLSSFADPLSGFRRVAQDGQAGGSGRWVLRNLPKGTYSWAVQSVDAAYRGSAFSAEHQFSITNSQPTVVAFPNQTMAMNSVLGPLQVAVNDPDGDAASLVLSVISSNPRLFPPGSIALSGAGMLRGVFLTPAANEAGNATLIFTVADPSGGTASASTRITVQSLVDTQVAFPDGQFSILEPADADNDGDLDLLLAGTELISGSSGRASVRLFVNSGDATFTVANPPLAPVFDGSFAAWSDYDADGDLDLFYGGAIYRQDGGGFVSVNSDLAGIQNGQAAWGDYDADGDLDLAVTGAHGVDGYVTRIYRNDGDSLFTRMGASLVPLHYSSLAWGDPDGDGDLDLAVAGAAAANVLLSPNARLYRNDGDDRFVEALNFFGVVNSKLTWGDVNGDGLADLVATGGHGSETVNNLLLNLGGWRFATLPLQPGGLGWTDTKLLDWDRDGDLDLLAGVNSIVAVHLNPGTGEFPTTSSASTSLRCRALRWGDFDNDAEFDVLVSNVGTTGFSGATRLYRNPRIDSSPAPPLALTAETHGNSVVLSWPESPALQGAPVTYNVRVGTASGRGDVLGPLSRGDGRRLVPATGNAGFAHSLTLRELPPGAYSWSVQAVDVTWRGQPWLPEASFRIDDPLSVRITSVEVLGATRIKLKFEAPAGRAVAIEVSSDLKTWAQRLVVQVGVAGRAEAEVLVNGPGSFCRLAVTP